MLTLARSTLSLPKSLRISAGARSDSRSRNSCREAQALAAVEDKIKLPASRLRWLLLHLGASEAAWSRLMDAVAAVQVIADMLLQLTLEIAS
jgi:hypothetical protein